MSFELRQLDFAADEARRTPDLLTVQVAKLINSEVFADPGGHDGSLEDFLQHLRLPNVEGYALLSAESSLLGAATAEFTPEYTFIASIAVQREVRRLGHGRRLIRQIASRAIELGSPQLRLYADTPALLFYARLGFQMDTHSRELVASPELLI